MSCNTTQQVRFQLRRGNAAYWDAHASDVLKSGEPGFNTSENKLKIGNDTDSWAALEYINVAGPVGTYTTIVPSTNIPGNVTLESGSTVFTLSTPLSAYIPAGQRVRFTETVVPPLLTNTSYYAVDARASGDINISVSKSPGGVNIVMLLSVSTRFSSTVTLTSPQSDIAVGQAVFFVVLPDGEGLLNTATLYYVVDVLSTTALSVALSPGGAAIVA